MNFTERQKTASITVSSLLQHSLCCPIIKLLWCGHLSSTSSAGLATSVVPAGEAGVGLIQCPDDYLIMAGTRLCGDRLNDGSGDPQPTNNGPVTGTYSIHPQPIRCTEQLHHNVAYTKIF